MTPGPRNWLLCHCSNQPIVTRKGLLDLAIIVIIVIIDNNTTPKTVHLYELTSPFSTNILTANSYKKDKYAGLKDDIIQNGYICHVIPFEICSRGFIPRRVKLILLSMMKTFTTIKPPLNHKHIVNISKIALLSSFSIFHARKSRDWNSPPRLSP